ncbi:MAG: T9SS type A sorting domain-containing protein [Bacteroidota bacterium]|nr:T9SS type A sorting domain-containing protein [Bacteroidota bacterium]
MKKRLLLLQVLFVFSFEVNAQVDFMDAYEQQSGATVNITMVRNAAIDAGSRLGYQTTIASPAGGALYRIKYGNSAHPSSWIIEYSGNGGVSWLLDFYNDVASSPLPPSMINGTWVADPTDGVDTYGNPDVLITLSGDVQDEALPVTLLSFTGKSSSDGNQLSWTATVEINVSSYVIERSSDGQNFSSIGTVAAKNGGSNYEFTDATAIDIARIYYRLRMIDNDGHYQYSAIVSIINSGNNDSKYRIVPNPVTSDILNIKTGNTTLNGIYITILDVTGKKELQMQLSAAELNEGNIHISVSALSAGTYFLQIRDEKNNVTTLKFIKQ